MQTFEILLYSTPDSKATVEVYFEGETFWLSQKKMAELFNVDVRTINDHLEVIFSTNELNEEATIRKFRIVQNAIIIMLKIASSLAKREKILLVANSRPLIVYLNKEVEQ